MAKNKTTVTAKSVEEFLSAITDETKRDDSFGIIQIMKDRTGFDAHMWGPSIIGFGSYHYKYDSGHEGDAPLVGFSPRASAISLYLFSDFEDKEKLLKKFGKHKAAKGCLYIKRLEDVDVNVLKKMIDLSVKVLKKKYPEKK